MHTLYKYDPEHRAEIRKSRASNRHESCGTREKMIKISMPERLSSGLTRHRRSS
jgi:hypothetical protein